MVTSLPSYPEVSNMGNTSYVVLHTINGYAYPTFHATTEYGVKYGWDTEDVRTAQVWDSLPLAEQLAAELNSKVPAGVVDHYGPADLWRVEPLTDWV
jgi:hypothetical protein